MSESDIPEDEFSPEELAEASALAGRVDELLQGKRAPVIGDGEERELLQLSSIIHASHNEVALPSARKADLIEAAMAQATGAGRADFKENEQSDIERARARRKSGVRFGMVGALAAAAVTFLVWRSRPPQEGLPDRPVAVQLEILENEQSRPSDALIGQIAQSESAAAAERLRRVHDDRLAGYRSLSYRQMGATQ